MLIRPALAVRLLLVAAALPALLLVTACASEPTRPAASDTRSESPTLVRALRAELVDLFPDDSAASIDQLLQTMRTQYAEALLVTPIEEAAMRLGRFDDVTNLNRLEQLLVAAEKQEVPIHTLLRRMLEQLRGNKLTGARLELTTRLLDAQVRAAAVQNLQRSL